MIMRKTAGLLWALTLVATSAGWAQLQGEYYNGTTLGDPSGTPANPDDVFLIVFSHRDAPINFKVETGNQWYLGAGTNRVHDPDDPGLPGPPDFPTAYVGPADFCVRWRGQIRIPTTGDYTFYCTVKDGVRFYVDNIADGAYLGPDHWSDNGLQTYSYTVTGLTAGKHEIRMDYVNRTGTAEARLAWAGPGIAQQIIPQEYLLPPPHGLVASFYNYADWTWNFTAFPDPAKIRYDRDLNWIWGGFAADEGAENTVAYDYFSVVWKGMVEVLVGSRYTFQLQNVDDNAYLKVNGQTLITDDGTIGVVGGETLTGSPSLTLVPGKYRIEVGLREVTGDAMCKLYWKRTAQSVYSQIPAAQLYPYISPSDILLSNNQIAENAGANVLIGTLSTDLVGSDFTYTLVTGTGDTDNARFSISGNGLYAVNNFDYEDAHGPAYSLRVQSTDTTSGEFIAKAFTVNVLNANDIPYDLVLSNAAINENAGVNAEVGQLSALDQDAGQSYSYSLVTGAGDTDNNWFNIQGNVLRASASLDYETRPACQVRIRVTDNGATPASYEKTFTIQILDVVEPPTGITLANTTIPENAGPNASVGILSTQGPCTGPYTYSLVDGDGGADNAQFYLNNDQLVAKAGFDYETRALYQVRLRSTDNTPPNYFVDLAFSINITNVNEAPASIQLSSSALYENAGPNAIIGALSVVDPDTGQLHAYSLVPGEGADDNLLFNLLGNMLRANSSFDYETRQTYQIRVQATDTGFPALSLERAFTINVLDIAEPILGVALSKTRIDENAGPDAEVGQLSTQGQGSGYSYQLVPGVGGEDNNLFNIAANTLRANASFNYEARALYQVRIQSREEAHPETTYEQTFTISVHDINEAPVDITLSSNSIDEYTGPNAVVGFLTTSDPDFGQIHTYDLVDGEGAIDNSAVNISGTLLRINDNPDYRIHTSYRIRVSTRDSSIPGLTFEKAFVIHVLDMPDPDNDIRLTNSFLPENAGENAFIGTLAVTGGGIAPFTYSLVAGSGDEDNGLFHITGSDLVANASLDYEQRAAYHIRVQSQDSDSPARQATAEFTITLLDVNEPPTDMLLSNAVLNENAGTNAFIGALSSVDPDRGQIHFYTLVPGDGADHNGLFNINGAVLRASGSFDFETQSQYSIRIQTTDNGGSTYEEVFLINIQDVNEAPVGIVLSNKSVDENAAPGTAIGSLSSLDPDQGQMYAYSFVSGPGSADNALFSLVGNELRTNARFDFENDATYSVRIKTTDNGNPGLSYAQSFLIDINNLNEAPRALLLSNRFVSSGTGPDMYVGSFSTIDPDIWSAQSFLYQLVSGEGDSGNTHFQIVENKLYTGLDFDPAMQPFSIRVRTTDDGINPDALSREEIFIISADESSESLRVDFVRLLDADPPQYITSMPMVRFLVSFNKSVAGVDLFNSPPPGGSNDFFPIISGNVTGAFVSAVVGEGSTYIVMMNTGHNDGWIGLEVRHDSGIQANVGGQSLLAPYDQGPGYIIDKNPLAFLQQPEGGYKSSGDTHEFKVIVTGAQGSCTYEWKRDEIPVGDNSGVLLLTDLSTEDEGCYTCQVSDDWEEIVSNQAYLYVSQGMPAAGIPALLLLTGVIGAVGSILRRRQK